MLSLALSIPANASLADPLQKVSATSLSCQTTYTRAMFHTGARSYFHRPSPAKKRVLKRLVKCQRSKRSRRNVRFHLARYRRAHAHRQAVNRLTPYDCGSAGRFAIPCGIVRCESGFSWSAYNASGAAGPYQIMPEWGRPFPANTPATRLRHHQLAAMIWRGGAGASNWVCKG